MKKMKLYFVNLDGIRFVAFFTNFASHLLVSFNPAENSIGWVIQGQHILNVGTQGVTLFFVLSGFLITYLMMEEERSFEKIHIKNFYVRRILRIWPLYYLTIGIGFMIFPFLKSIMGMVPNETADPLLYVFMAANYSTILNGHPDSSILGVLWSVAIEEQFYLLWPLAMHYLRKYRLSIILFVILLSTLSIGFKLEHPFGTLYNMNCLAIGALFAWLAFNKNYFRVWLEKLNKLQIVIIYIFGIVLSLSYNEFRYKSSVFDALMLPAVSVFFAFILVEQEYARNSFYKFSNFKRMSYWGKYTYGLYCLHQIGILTAMVIGLKLAGLPLFVRMGIVEPLIALAVSMAISYVVFHFYEKPFLNLKSRFAFITKE